MIGYSCRSSSHIISFPSPTRDNSTRICLNNWLWVLLEGSNFGFIYMNFSMFYSSHFNSNASSFFLFDLPYTFVKYSIVEGISRAFDGEFRSFSWLIRFVINTVALFKFLYWVSSLILFFILFRRFSLIFLIHCFLFIGLELSIIYLSYFPANLLI